MRMRTNIFLFLLSIFLDFIFLFFWISFLFIDNEEAHDPTIEAIKYNDQQCLDIGDLWNALHSTSNMALHCQVDVEVLDEIADKLTSPWPSFSKEEFRLTITSCNNASAPSPDKLLWSYLKIILKDNECLNIIIHIANTCIELGYWPSHFKRSTTVVIPKPNKKLYDSLKSFRPIVLHSG